MDFERARTFIAEHWAKDVLPTLWRYIEIPCVSPAFEPNWAEVGHMGEAATLLLHWAEKHLAPLPGVSIGLRQLEGRTPVLFIEVAASGISSSDTALIYGHYDKQPAMTGWKSGRGAWTPVLEDDRLYGRGGADDGYAIFSSVLALRALHDQGQPFPRCVILIEGCEESNSEDLPFYIEALAERIGTPALIIALDSMCGNYEQLWLTSSLRGQVAGTLSVRVLSDAMHSGEASGIVPSSFRVATNLLGRIENPATGEIKVAGLIADVPPFRVCEASAAADVLGSSVYNQMPFLPGARPVGDDVTRLLIDRSWAPGLVITGIDGLPPTAEAAAVMQPYTSLKVSVRLPPTVNSSLAANQIKAILEKSPPYGCDVTFDIAFATPGWHAPETAAWLSESLNEVSQAAFGKACIHHGGGGGIPFLNMLGERFPDAQFVVTGVLGPQSNAHGPNEFLHVPTTLNVTLALAGILQSATKAWSSPRSDR